MSSTTRRPITLALSCLLALAMLCTATTPAGAAKPAKKAPPASFAPKMLATPVTPDDVGADARQAARKERHLRGEGGSQHQDAHRSLPLSGSAIRTRSLCHLDADGRNDRLQRLFLIRARLHHWPARAEGEVTVHAWASV